MYHNASSFRITLSRNLKPVNRFNSGYLVGAFFSQFFFPNGNVRWFLSRKSFLVDAHKVHLEIAIKCFLPDLPHSKDVAVLCKWQRTVCRYGINIIRVKKQQRYLFHLRHEFGSVFYKYISVNLMVFHVW
jgi:hypothetical protein